MTKNVLENEGIHEVHVIIGKGECSIKLKESQRKWKEEQFLNIQHLLKF